VASASQVNLSWNDIATDETGYRVERSLDGEHFSPIATLPAGSKSFSNVGLTAAPTYYYRVCAFKGSGDSDFTNVLSTRLVAPDAKAAEAEPAREQRGAQDAVILLVDDEADVRGSLGVMLRTLGRDVHAVASADEALRWLSTSTPGLVLTDLEMPGMTGPVLAEAVHERRPAVPVVLMTGWATDGDTLPPHCAAILPKPLRMAQLRQVLDRLLGRVA